MVRSQHGAKSNFAPKAPSSSTTPLPPAPHATSEGLAIDLALCYAGHIRTYAHAAVRRNHAVSLVEPLLRSGRAAVEAFAALDVGKDRRDLYSPSAEAVVAALRDARLVRAVVYNSDHLTTPLPANVERRALELPSKKPPSRCVNAAKERGMLHLLPQFAKVRDAFGLALEHERSRPRRYSHLTFLRPDIYFGAAVDAAELAAVSHTRLQTAWCKDRRRSLRAASCPAWLTRQRLPRPTACSPNDWFSAVPRHLAPLYANVTPTASAHCHSRRDYACAYCELGVGVAITRSPVTECVLDVVLTKMALPLEEGGGRLWPHKMMLARSIDGGGDGDGPGTARPQCSTPIGYSTEWRRTHGSPNKFDCEWMAREGK